MLDGCVAGLVSSSVNEQHSVLAPVFVLLRQLCGQPGHEQAERVAVRVDLRHGAVELAAGADCQLHRYSRGD